MCDLIILEPVMKSRSFFQIGKPPMSAIAIVGPALLCFAFSGAVASHAQSVDEVGESVRIKNQVNASINDRSLAPRDPVFSSESITAGINSHGEIRLNDQSKVLVGENSSISLDDFVVGNRGFASGTIKVAKGAFRFITGNSEKGAFTVETPVSTIGARGTVFDVYVDALGNTRVILFQGEVEVCSSSNCIVSSRACDIVEVDEIQASEGDYLRSAARQEENQKFDLTDRQRRFQQGWRAPTLVCAIRAAIDPNRSGNRPDEPGVNDGNSAGDNFGNDTSGRGKDD